MSTHDEKVRLKITLTEEEKTVSASDKMSENAEEKMQVCGGEEEKKIDSQ